MSFQETVQHLRALADPCLLTQVVQHYSEPDDIEPWAHIDALLWPDLPANEQSARAQLPAGLSQLTEELEGYIARYNDLRSRGLDAMSDYDLGVAYARCGPEFGLFQALEAVANHIGRTRGQILWLLDLKARLTPPQLALF